MIKILEEKQLLLVDLCARLPYNVIVHRTYIWGEELKEDDGELEVFDMDSFLNESVEKLNKQGCTIKPYLRRMSSMTEEEKKEYGKVCELDTEILANHPMNGEPFPALYNSQDWLNKHHFDYRGLIELGLALKAPEGMYEY